MYMLDIIQVTDFCLINYIDYKYINFEDRSKSISFDFIGDCFFDEKGQFQFFVNKEKHSVNEDGKIDINPNFFRTTNLITMFEYIHEQKEKKEQLDE